MISSSIFRLVLTILVFIVLKILGVKSLPLLIVLLFLFDALDCGRLSPFKNIDCKSIDYQTSDKIVDITTYAIFIILFKDLFDKFTYYLLIVLILFRLVGIIGFVQTNNNSYLKMFPDFVNSTLIAYAIYQYFNLRRETYYILIILGMASKIAFEQWLHKQTYH